MTLTGALNNAVSGMLTSQRQIETISGNVSNAQTPGFTEKNAAATTQVLAGRAAGAQVGELTRDSTPFLQRQVRQEQSGFEKTNTQANYAERVQNIFGDLGADSAMPNQLADLKSKFEQLGVEPSNSAARTEVVRQAETVARDQVAMVNGQAERTASGILWVHDERDALVGLMRSSTFVPMRPQEIGISRFASLREALSRILGQGLKAVPVLDEAVKTINDNLENLQTLNRKIADAEANGDPTVNLKDQRDKSLEEISKLVDIQTFNRDNGAVNVYLNNGSPLLNAEVNKLSFNASGTLPPGTEGNAVRGPTDEALGKDVGGKLGGLIELRDNTLPDLQGDLDRLAAKVREEINAVHNRSTKGNDAQKSITGGTSALTQVNPTPEAVSVDNVSGSFEISLVDSASGEVNSSVTVSAGDVTSVSGGGGPTGDTGTLDTADIVEAINNKAGVNAAIDSSTGEVTIEAANPGESIAIANAENFQVESASGINNSDNTRNVSHFLGLNNFFETPNTAVEDPPPAKLSNDPNLVTTNGTSAADSIRVREDITENTSLVGRGEARTTPGDTAIPVGDGTVAKDLAARFEKNVDFAGPQTDSSLPGSPERGNISERTTTLGGYAGDIIQFQSSETARLEENKGFKEDAVDNLKFRADSQAGVNIDEELAQLQQYQQSFQANARLISTTQTLFQSLNRAVA